jgi:hypothetical protein
LSFTESDWEDIIDQINDKRCTPFIGAGACLPWLPLGSKIANDWAETQKYHYPMDDKGQLDKVAQWVGIVEEDEMYPKLQVCKMLKKVTPPDFTKHKDIPHAILSTIDFPIYITTNYDKFMEEALKSVGKNPISEYCRWDEAIEEFADEESIFKDSEYSPDGKNPLVYHLHGRLDIPQSIVLTERDYISFLINLSKDEKLLPTAIRKAFAKTSLLFIGYSLNDINFRVIFQSIISILGPKLQFSSIAVQLPPNDEEDKKKKIMDYMNRYTKNMFKVNIHWGDAKEFVNELQIRLEKKT